MSACCCSEALFGICFEILEKVEGAGETVGCWGSSEAKYSLEIDFKLAIFEHSGTAYGLVVVGESVA